MKLTHELLAKRFFEVASIANMNVSLSGEPVVISFVSLQVQQRIRDRLAVTRSVVCQCKIGDVRASDDRHVLRNSVLKVVKRTTNDFILAHRGRPVTGVLE